MLEQTIVEAVKPILSLGFQGSVLIFMALTLIWTVRQWLAALNAKDEAKKAHLQDVKDISPDTQAIRSTLEGIQKNLDAVKAGLEILMERTRK